MVKAEFEPEASLSTQSWSCLLVPKAYLEACLGDFWMFTQPAIDHFHSFPSFYAVFVSIVAA